MCRANSSGVAAYLAAALCVATLATARAYAKGNDWILLVDTSKSIKGEGKDAKDISEEYQGSIKAFVQNLVPGDRLYVHTFDEKPTFQRFFQTTDKQSVAALASAFDDPVFQPHGDCTLIGDAINAGVIQARSLKNAGRLPGIVLFTDGIDTCLTSTTKRMADFATHPISEKDFPHGFYVVWAGAALDEGKLRSRFPVSIRDRIKIVSPERSAAVAEQARAASPPSLATPATTIDFGSVYRGGKTANRLVRIVATGPATVQFNLAGGAQHGIRLSGITQKPILLRAGDNDISLSIETDRATSPGIHDGILEVRFAEANTGQEASEPLLVFSVRIMASRFWFPPIWAWIACGLLFLVSAILLVAARTPRNESPEVGDVSERPLAARGNRKERLSDQPAVSLGRENDDGRWALLATKKASLNELQASLRKLKGQTGDLERRCALLEREISDLTSSLKGQ